MDVSKESILATADLLTAMAVEEIAHRKGISTDEALLGFLSSQTARMLYDNEEAKLWWDGPSAIADEYLRR